MKRKETKYIEGLWGLMVKKEKNLLKEEKKKEIEKERVGVWENRKKGGIDKKEKCSRRYKWWGRDKGSRQGKKGGVERKR